MDVVRDFHEQWNKNLTDYGFKRDWNKDISSEFCGEGSREVGALESAHPFSFTALPCFLVPLVPLYSSSDYLPDPLRLSILFYTIGFSDIV